MRDECAPIQIVGNRTVKVVPTFSSLATSIVPPCASTIAWEIERPRPLPPVERDLSALDANHDGVIDADEIANAPAALKSLDKNGDGKLTPDAFIGKRPQHGHPDGKNGDVPPNDAPSGPPPAQN